MRATKRIIIVVAATAATVIEQSASAAIFIPPVGDWDDPNNWSGGYVPTTGYEAEIGHRNASWAFQEATLDNQQGNTVRVLSLGKSGGNGTVNITGPGTNLASDYVSFGSESSSGAQNILNVSNGARLTAQQINSYSGETTISVDNASVDATVQAYFANEYVSATTQTLNLANGAQFRAAASTVGHGSAESFGSTPGQVTQKLLINQDASSIMNFGNYLSISGSDFEDAEHIARYNDWAVSNSESPGKVTINGQLLVGYGANSKVEMSLSANQGSDQNLIFSTVYAGANGEIGILNIDGISVTEDGTSPSDSGTQIGYHTIAGGRAEMNLVNASYEGSYLLLGPYAENAATSTLSLINSDMHFREASLGFWNGEGVLEMDGASQLNVDTKLSLGGKSLTALDSVKEFDFALANSASDGKVSLGTNGELQIGHGGDSVRYHLSSNLGSSGALQFGALNIGADGSQLAELEVDNVNITVTGDTNVGTYLTSGGSAALRIKDSTVSLHNLQMANPSNQNSSIELQDSTVNSTGTVGIWGTTSLDALNIDQNSQFNVDGTLRLRSGTANGDQVIYDWGMSNTAQDGKFSITSNSSMYIGDVYNNNVSLELATSNGADANMALRYLSLGGYQTSGTTAGLSLDGVSLAVSNGVVIDSDGVGTINLSNGAALETSHLSIGGYQNAIRGSGTVSASTTLNNSGKIIADGGTLKVDGAVDHLSWVTGTGAGWYADNGGRLEMALVTDSMTSANWGESAGDTTPDLINALRITDFQGTNINAMSLALDDDTASGVFSGLMDSIGVWDFDFGKANVGFLSMDVLVHFDDLLASALSLAESDIGVFQYGSTFALARSASEDWTTLGFALDEQNNYISFQLTASTVPLPSTLPAIVIGLIMLALARVDRADMRLSSVIVFLQLRGEPGLPKWHLRP